MTSEKRNDRKNITLITKKRLVRGQAICEISNSSAWYKQILQDFLNHILTFKCKWPTVCNHNLPVHAQSSSFSDRLMDMRKKVQVEIFSSFGSRVRLSFCAENLASL